MLMTPSLRARAYGRSRTAVHRRRSSGGSVITRRLSADRNTSGELAMGLEAAHSNTYRHAGKTAPVPDCQLSNLSGPATPVAATTVRLIDQAHLQQIHTGNQRVTGITVETQAVSAGSCGRCDIGDRWLRDCFNSSASAATPGRVC